MKIVDVYERLLRSYGPRGWWPLVSRAGADGRDEGGYLPGFYEPPDGVGAFEIAVGAVLTQNTAWLNAERALRSLLELGPLSPEALRAIPEEVLASVIRPSGYYNAKARKLFFLSDFFRGLRPFGASWVPPDRESLLSVWGIGPETADSILLYSFGIPRFVADAYARRILARIGLAPSDFGYEALRLHAEADLPKDAALHNELHALLVEHAKRACRKSPVCGECPLADGCVFARNSSRI